MEGFFAEQARLIRAVGERRRYLYEAVDRDLRCVGILGARGTGKTTLMLQMVRVGEETGNLDVTLLTVSHSYSMEAEYKLKSAITLLQPAMTVFIGLIVGLIALSMTSALYGIYGQGF